MRGQHFAAELKNWIKSNVASPMTKLEIGKLTSTILPSRRMRLNCLALAQRAKKALKRVNGVLLNPRRGAFGKSVRRKFKKVVFFGDRKHFPRRSVCQSGARIGHRQKKRGGKVENGAPSFYSRRGQKRGQIELFY